MVKVVGEVECLLSKFAAGLKGRVGCAGGSGPACMGRKDHDNNRDREDDGGRSSVHETMIVRAASDESAPG